MKAEEVTLTKSGLVSAEGPACLACFKGRSVGFHREFRIQKAPVPTLRRVESRHSLELSKPESKIFHRTMLDWALAHQDFLLNAKPDTLLYRPFGYDRFDVAIAKDPYLKGIVDALRELREEELSDNELRGVFEKVVSRKHLYPDSFDLKTKSLKKALKEEFFRSIGVGLTLELRAMLAPVVICSLWAQFLLNFCAKAPMVGYVKGFFSGKEYLSVATEVLLEGVRLPCSPFYNCIKTGLKGSTKSLLDYGVNGMVTFSTIGGVFYFAAIEFLIAGAVKGLLREVFKYLLASVLWGGVLGSMAGAFLICYFWDQSKIVFVGKKEKTE